jgi:hypothetical protein
MKKLNDSFAGQGNAIVDIDPVQQLLKSSNGSLEDAKKSLWDVMRDLKCVCKTKNWESFAREIRFVYICILYIYTRELKTSAF